MSGSRSGSLCDACRHARLVRSRRNRFLLCERSLEDARFPRYPRLPVLTCDGFVPLPSRDGRSADSGRLTACGESDVSIENGEAPG